MFGSDRNLLRSRPRPSTALPLFDAESRRTPRSAPERRRRYQDGDDDGVRRRTSGKHCNETGDGMSTKAPTDGRQQLWASIVFMVLAILWNNVFQIMAETIVQPLNQPLPPDLAHSLANGHLADWIPAAFIVDVIVLILLAMTVGRFVLGSPRSAALVVLRRYCILQGVVFLIRGPALYVSAVTRCHRRAFRHCRSAL